jgi:hypothetical protein
MPSPLFEFFEAIADELVPATSRVITRDDLKIDEQTAFVFDELKEELGASTTAEAIEMAVTALDAHFSARGAMLPFSYDATTGRFTVVDPDYLTFIKEMRRIRSIGIHSRKFECSVAERLGRRATGAVHRVGHPRDQKRRSVEFNSHLKSLGFGEKVLFGKEKDGGLDILWMLPVGAVPHRPLVSVQCKNGVINLDAAHASVGSGGISLGAHRGLQAVVHVPCVLFNDYITSSDLTPKAMNFVPLGLTDLAPLQVPAVVELL